MKTKNFIIGLTVASFSIGISGLPLSAQTQTPEYSELACQREINRQLTDQRNSFVRFDDSVEQSFVSKTERRIQGEGQQVLTNSNGSIVPSTFTYDCLVNTRNGQVREAKYALSGNSQNTNTNTNTNNTNTNLSDERAISLCQEKLKSEISADAQQINVGGVVSINTQASRNVEFDDSAETYSISRNELGVRGEATVRQGKSEKPISYTCTVNLRQEEVTRTDYQ